MTIMLSLLSTAQEVTLCVNEKIKKFKNCVLGVMLGIC